MVQHCGTIDNTKEVAAMGAVVKSTINISVQLKEELAKYVSLKVIPSFSSGVNTAIEFYLKELRRAEYDRLMEEASRDKDFLARTLDCQKDMTRLESEVSGEW
jgi:hypothetical protein